MKKWWSEMSGELPRTSAKNELGRAQVPMRPRVYCLKYVAEDRFRSLVT